MQLSGKILINVNNVNSFDWADAACFTEGDAPQIFFQLVDITKDTVNCGFNPSGRRYCPASGATVQVSLLSYDDARKVVRYATQPYPTTDSSIWCLTLFATDDIKGIMDLNFTLTEGTSVKRGVIHNALSVAAQTQAY